MQKYANLVELEKCCQTHVLLQNFVLIQPRTSPQKIAKFALMNQKSAPSWRLGPHRAVHLVEVDEAVLVLLVHDLVELRGDERQQRREARAVRVHGGLPDLLQELYVDSVRLPSATHFLNWANLKNCQTLPKFGGLVLGCIEADCCK